jgi:hypothetical protein
VIYLDPLVVKLRGGLVGSLGYSLGIWEGGGGGIISLEQGLFYYTERKVNNWLITLKNFYRLFKSIKFNKKFNNMKIDKDICPN